MTVEDVQEVTALEPWQNQGFPFQPSKYHE
ncbi:hypothetical protein PL9631_900094 [Planktothrix paucivesiculata PCC 9631]|uniref:Uncharacterized protein n=1 Tax=Planktothrix paucivesiculata PCC 9631 TaxID=671071 RepID=A0A7Z9C0W9_9CYAN|nr:hypothetical protein PL9631_900094 [Planktothrix paucivesiculata PCC 9631]